jgi:DNA-nicking Smr family endonuclease
VGDSGLNDDDRKLWSLVARQLEPLKSTEQRLKDEARKAAIEAAAAPGKPERPPSKTSKGKARPKPVAAVPDKAVIAPAVPRDGGRGRVAGLDRRTSERLRRGQYPIEARLDLHGMNQEQAHRALALFVRQCHAARKRCVLVITGKGGRQKESRDGPYVNTEPPGVLKRKVPEWLRQADLSPLVLSSAAATPAHGGAGALYILLKRQRDT